MDRVSELLDKIFRSNFSNEEKDKLQLLNTQNEKNYERYIKELKKNKELICKIESLHSFIENQIKKVKLQEEDLSLYLGKLIAYQTVLNYMEGLNVSKTCNWIL